MYISYTVFFLPSFFLLQQDSLSLSTSRINCASAAKRRGFDTFTLVPDTGGVCTVANIDLPTSNYKNHKILYPYVV